MAVIKCSECGGGVSTSAKICPHCGASAKKFKKNPGFGRFILLVFVGLFVISRFMPDKDEPSTSSTVASTGSLASTAPSTSPLVLASTNPRKFSDEHICKAAISTAMGRPVASMVSSKSGDVVSLSYIRADDKEKFEYKCTIATPVVVWATKIDGKWGRWRNDPADPKITFKEDGEVLHVTESYGESSKTVESFSLSDF